MSRWFLLQSSICVSDQNREENKVMCTTWSHLFLIKKITDSLETPLHRLLLTSFGPEHARTWLWLDVSHPLCRVEIELTMDKAEAGGSKWRWSRGQVEDVERRCCSPSGESWQWSTWGHGCGWIQEIADKTWLYKIGMRGWAEWQMIQGKGKEEKEISRMSIRFLASIPERMMSFINKFATTERGIFRLRQTALSRNAKS